MRVWTGIVLLVFAQGLTGCDSRLSSLPTAPTSTQPPAPPPTVADRNVEIHYWARSLRFGRGPFDHRAALLLADNHPEVGRVDPLERC
jgi:hypothetical protein